MSKKKFGKKSWKKFQPFEKVSSESILWFWNFINLKKKIVNGSKSQVSITKKGLSSFIISFCIKQKSAKINREKD